MEKCNIRIQCFLKEEIYVNRLKQCRSSLEQRLGGQSIAHGCTSHRWSITRINPRFRVLRGIMTRDDKAAMHGPVLYRGRFNTRMEPQRLCHSLKGYGDW